MQRANILDAEAVLFIVCFLAIQCHPSRIILFFFLKEIPRHERVGTLKNGLWNEREMRVA